MLKIKIILFNGFDELDALAPFEVLQTAAAMGADIQTELVTLDAVTEVIAAHGLRISPQDQFNVNEPFDLLIVPGGGWGNCALQGAWGEVQRGEIPKAIAQVYQNGTTIASVCTGGMLVAAAGLLQGRPAITHHLALADLREKGAEIINARVVDDGNIITSGGVTSGLDLALWLLERYCHGEMAQNVAEEMEYERSGNVWQQSTGLKQKKE
jgi:transcriptional regulator GlxA family with amidase domain